MALITLGDEYVARLRKLYQGRVPGGADLVTYWFEKARAQIAVARVRYVGLVATNSIRGGANRKVLDCVAGSGAIFHAWADEPWINEGAAVRVSLVAFGPRGHGRSVVLDGVATDAIHPDLCASTGHAVAMDLTVATRMSTNAKTAFNGIQKTGAFEVPGCLARKWLQGPTNPDGSDNRTVLCPYWNGLDLTRRTRDQWIIDFGWSMDESEAALFEQPFQHLVEHVKPVRATNTLEALRRDWWRFWRPRQEMRRSIADLPRYIVTPEVSKHRLFAWLRLPTLPDKNLIVIARSDDTTFGILHSRLHEVWALRMGTSLEDRPRYTPTTTFETFPFPDGLTPVETAGAPQAVTADVLAPRVALSRRPFALAIAKEAHRLNALREGWLNPPEWVERVPEVVPGYPDRIIPKPEYGAEIKKRTLTNLYNARPAWLDQAHRALDTAVVAAYGWDDYSPAMADPEILRRLLALNQARAPQLRPGIGLPGQSARET